MIATVVISAVACLGVMLLVLLKSSIVVRRHKISIYYFPALIGAVLLLATRCVDFSFVIESLTADSAVNPLKILILFISMTLLSVYLDEVGFFRYLATAALRHAGHNGLRLFTVLYFVVGILTVVTSNDIIVLTFSPFICYFAKNAKINPLPYLVGEFISANTWSMALIIGNPTNIFLAGGAGENFAEYCKNMALPTLFAGLSAYLVLLAIFGRSLKKEQVSAQTAIIHVTDKVGLIIGLIHLASCTALLAVASYIKWEMWIICLAFALSLFLSVAIHKIIHKNTPKELLRCLKRAPWELIPFVLSMFVIVLSLQQNGVCTLISDLGSDLEPGLLFGIGTFLISNIINNIPASVFVNSVLSASSYAGKVGVYAAIIGTNIGAYLTPVGALAGIMWSSILSRNDIRYSFSRFVAYGAIIAVPTLFAALGGLYLSFII